MKNNQSKTDKFFVILLLVACGLVATVVMTVIGNKRNEEAYAKAEQLILNEAYDDALEILKKIEDKKIKDTVSLIRLCNAHIEYNDGNVRGAHYAIEDIRFSYQNEEQLAKIEVFKEAVEKEYNEYLSEQAKKEAQRDEMLREFYSDKVPYEGMSEKYIDYTLAGPHDEYIPPEERNVERGTVIGSYRWKADGTDKTVLAVSCMDGEIISVSKYCEDTYWTADGKPHFHSKRSSSWSSSYSSGSKKNNSTHNDPYNAKDYYDAEDFYDDYYDEFYDYEEAEEYYDEYGMWN